MWYVVVAIGGFVVGWIVACMFGMARDADMLARIEELERERNALLLALEEEREGSDRIMSALHGDGEVR